MMETGMAILIVLVAVILVGAVAQLIFNNRSGSLDDSGSGPVRHSERGPPGRYSEQRRDHDW